MNTDPEGLHPAQIGSQTSIHRIRGLPRLQANLPTILEPHHQLLRCITTYHETLPRILTRISAPLLLQHLHHTVLRIMHLLLERRHLQRHR